jgi:hypothetical protein
MPVLFWIIPPGFHFFGIRKSVIFLRSNVFSLTFNAQLGPSGPYIDVPSDEVAQLNPQVPGSRLVAFHDSQSYGGSILIHLHKIIILRIT